MVLLENRNHECLLAFYWKCLMMKKMNSNFSFYTFHSTELKNNFYTMVHTPNYFFENKSNIDIYFYILKYHHIFPNIWYVYMTLLDKYNKCR